MSRLMRFLVRAAAGGLLLAAGFTAGNLCPPLLQRSIQPGPVSPPGVTAAPATAALSPNQERGQALAEVGARVRHLLGRRESLETAPRETRLAYTILRGRGVGAEAEECQRLIRRQQHLQEEIQVVDRFLVEARQVEDRLRGDEVASGPGDSDGVGPEGLQATRGLLGRLDAGGSARPLIPAYRWQGGPDQYMGLAPPPPGGGTSAAKLHAEKP